MRGTSWLLAAVVLALAALFALACGDDDDDDDVDEAAEEVEETTEEAAAEAEEEVEEAEEELEEEAEEEATEPAEEEETAAENGAAEGAINVSGVEELEDGNLQVLSDIPYAPIEFFDDNDNVVGVDPDIAAAIAGKLGVDYEFIPTGFDAIIPALNAGDGDVIMSAMTVNEERDEQVDFVEYLNVGTGIAVQAGNPQGIAGFTDLCGLAVSVQAVTIQEEQLGELNEGNCADRPIDIRSFPEQPIATQELADGNVDAMVADYPVVFEAAQTSEGSVEALDVQEGAAPYGIACRTESPLCAILQEAFDAIVEDGTYDEILESWDLTSARLE